MATRRNLKNNDWSFGNGLKDYLTKSAEIKQNVITRLYFYKDDWFLDMREGIDYINILGNKKNEEILKQELLRVILNTEGVVSVDTLNLTVSKGRKATVNITYTDIYNENISLNLDLT